MYDVIIVGGGHNGLVAAGYLAATKLRVLVLEGKDILGGPAATVEFMPGYRASITNSPGSLEPQIVQDLELEKYGLTFVRPDPTLVHPFSPDRLYVGWREKHKNDAQLESIRPGEAARYDRFFQYLQDFADKLGISLFGPPPTLQDLVRNLTSDEDQEAFSRIMFGSIRDLMEEFGLAPETKALITPLAVVGGQVTPSTPGTPFNLMIRPLSLASQKAQYAAHDPRRMPLRGSTGLPIGGMGAIIAALKASLASNGGEIITNKKVASFKTKNGRITGVVTEAGDEYNAPVVISALNPRTTATLIEDDGSWGALHGKLLRKTMRGRAFKVVLALDGIPRYAAAKSDEENRLLMSAQFRIAPTLEYIEEAHSDMMLGRLSHKPMIWGLCPSLSSPDLAPPGKQVLSMNIGNAPYHLRDGSWETQRDVMVKRVIATLTDYMPNLPDLITDTRCIDPVSFEQQFGLVEANISHGDPQPWNSFWMRPMAGLQNYRTPTAGLYLSGNGTWPGNFVSGIAGHNTAQAVLQDMKENADRRTA